MQRLWSDKSEGTSCGLKESQGGYSTVTGGGSSMAWDCETVEGMIRYVKTIERRLHFILIKWVGIGGLQVIVAFCCSERKYGKNQWYCWTALACRWHLNFGHLIVSKFHLQWQHREKTLNQDPRCPRLSLDSATHFCATLASLYSSLDLSSLPGNYKVGMDTVFISLENDRNPVQNDLSRMEYICLFIWTIQGQ